MKFPSFLRSLGKRWLNQESLFDRRGLRRRPGRRPRGARPHLECLEDRTVLSVLPAPLTNGNLSSVVGTNLTLQSNPPGTEPGDTTALTSFTATVNNSSPSVAVDPLNPQKLVATYTINAPNTNGVQQVFSAFSYSNNGGLSWSPINFGNGTPPAIPNTFITLTDPTSPANTGNTINDRPFAESHASNVAFDRNHHFYFALTEQDANVLTAGDVIVEGYDFSGGVPTQLVGNRIYRWVGADPALNVTVAVDNNVPMFTDTNTVAGQPNVQTDPFVQVDPANPQHLIAPIYVAWNTNYTAPTGATAAFNPNTIQVAASADGGLNFTTPVPVNDGNTVTSMVNPQHFADPTLTVSQGNVNGTVSGGQLTIAFDDFGQNQIVTNRIQNGGIGALFTQNFTDPTTGIIKNATAGANGAPDTPQTTTFSQVVNITDTHFTSVTDFDVSVVLQHPNLNEIKVVLVPPGNSGLQPIPLILNRLNAAGNPITPMGAAGPQGLPAGVNLGIINGHDVGTVFDEQAARNITDPNAAAPYIGHFQTEDFLAQNGGIGLNAINGLLRAAINGTWTLQITDFRANGANPPVQRLHSWSINFTSGLTPARDVVAAGNPAIVGAPNPVTGAVDHTFPLKPAAAPDNGIGPNAVLASDNTLGAFSPFEGRIYLAYTGIGSSGTAGDTDIYLVASDDGGAHWNALGGNPVQVNDDSPADNFSGGNRPQFQPSIAVDQSTGTLVLSFLDTRNDAAQARVATYVATSIDGGQTFAPETFMNPTQDAIDAITGKLVHLEPIPDNQGSGFAGRDTTFGFGTHQGLAVANGLIYPMWSSNGNSGALSVVTVQHTLPDGTIVGGAAIAAGPRIVSSTMGPVKSLTQDGVTFNNQFTSDGIQIPTGFVVEFDRPIDPSTFTLDQATVIFRNTTTPANMPGVLLNILSVTDLNPPDAGLFIQPGRDTRFLVRFDASNALLLGDTFTGTYSYTVGPNITDRIRKFTLSTTPASTATFLANDLPMPIPSDALTSNPPDTGGPNSPATTSNIAVSGFGANQVITKVTVNLSLTHTFDSDLLITLIAPNGTSVVLSNQNGGNGHNYTNTTFDDAGTVPIGSPTAAAPFTSPPSYRPDQPLSTFNLGLPNGTWTLKIQDLAAQDTGTLTNWSITIQTGTEVSGSSTGNLMDQNGNAVPGETPRDLYAAPRPLNPANFFNSSFLPPFDANTLPIIVPGPHVVSSSVPNQPTSSDNLILGASASAIDVVFDRDMNPATFTSASVLSMIGPSGAIKGPFTITPNPNNTDTDPLHPRTFRITFAADPTTAQVVSGTYVVQLASSIKAKNGDALDTNLNAGLDVLRGLSPTSTQTTGVRFSTSVPVPIAAQKTVVSTITVPVSQSFVIQGLTVQINLSYPLDRDLEAALVAPDGTRIRLFTAVPPPPAIPSNPDPNGPNFINTVFDDTAATPIQQGFPPFNSPGTYTPQEPLGQLIGRAAAGTYKLEITDNSTGRSGTINSWSINFQQPVPGTGLGEPVADRATVSFRIFKFAATDKQSQVAFVAMGPTSINDHSQTGSVTAVAVDPSDPSGNTVFVGGASGGVWKTNNFLTTDPNGPTYIPLTDSGPTLSLNIGSIAVFPRNNDPNQSFVIAATGDGNSYTIGGQPATGIAEGVGFLRSFDGGATWSLLDSTVNVDSQGRPLPINSALRDHAFVGTTAYKVIVDPHLSPTGNVIVYAALGGDNANIAGTQGGLWRSMDSGRTWQQVRPGQATDVALVPGSESLTSGNLLQLYAGFQGEGVFFSQNQGSSFLALPGGVGDPYIRDINGVAIPVTAPTSTPQGAKGRITLAVPTRILSTVEDSTVKNILYQGFVYAAVSTAAGNFDGLYVSKDFGQNWTVVHLNAIGAPPTQAPFGTNDETLGNLDIVTGTAQGAALPAPLVTPPLNNGNYDLALTVDPNNPNIVYLGGTELRFALALNQGPHAPGLIRVDLTNLTDAHDLVAFDNNDAGAGPLQVNTVGGVTNGTPGAIYGQVDTSNPANLIPPDGPFGPRGHYLNLLKDPNNIFLNNATLSTVNVTNINNTGEEVIWAPFNDATKADPFDPTSLQTTNIHVALAIRDPLTGRARLIFGDDQGVYSAVDLGDGTLSKGIGTAASPAGTRNGNLQLAQFDQGAAQPSIIAAEVAGAMLYGSAVNNGFPVSSANVITTGNLAWTQQRNVPPLGNGQGLGTDQTGSGTAYQFEDPITAFSMGLDQITDFFQTIEPGGVPVSRTQGLVQVPNNDPQWPFDQAFNFAINPISQAFDPKTGGTRAQQIVISSAAGRIFRTDNGGVNWFNIGDPTDLDSTNAQALAYGAPDPAISNGNLDNFIFAGTTGGHVFVTLTGGGNGQGSTNWIPLSQGLDGSAIQSISTSPVRGSHQAYAVTAQGVYTIDFQVNVSSSGVPTIAGVPTWKNITGNLFSLKHTIFGMFADHTGTPPITDTELQQVQLLNLSALAVDWRFLDPTHSRPPVLYVGGEGGVYRSLDNGRSWIIFPAKADGAWMDGGFLPNTRVTSLNLSLGNINPTTGRPDNSTGPDMLVVTTFGRGTFGIRLATDTLSVVPGPRIIAFDPSTPISPNVASFRVTFSEPIDPSTFTKQQITTFFGTQGVGVVNITSIVDLTPVPFGGPAPANAHTIFQVNFEPQTVDGNYSVSIGPNITDFAGDAMDQNNNGINGELPGDVFNATIVINSSDDGRFVTGLYHDLLGAAPTATTAGGRPADTNGFLALFTPADAARFNELDNVALEFVTSQENREKLIADFFGFEGTVNDPPRTLGNFGIGNFMHREAEPSALLYFTSLLQQGVSPEQITAMLVTSDEYFLVRGNNDNPTWVDQVYRDLLGRPGNDQGAMNFANELNLGLTTRDQVAQTLVNSTEYRRRLISQGYMIYLSTPGNPRVPTANEFNIWLNFFATTPVKAGQASLDEQFLANLLSSGQYFFNQPDTALTTLHTNLDWLKSLYTKLLQRDPNADPAGVSFHYSEILAAYQTQRQADVTMLVNSPEYRTRLIQGYYETYLHRQANSSEVASWLTALRTMTDEQVIEAIVSSDEYFNLAAGSSFNNPVNNGAWLEQLYRDVLNRDIDPSALGYFESVLTAGTMTRAQIAQAVVGSDEFRAKLVSTFYASANLAAPTDPSTIAYPVGNFLQRPAAPQDVNFWVGALRAGLRDEAMIVAMLDSEEYFKATHPFP
jgi:subtilisin-like proprotein convertase family protein